MGGLGFLNMLPQLPSFSNAGMDYAVFRKMRNNYASQVRHLRRREYQDMMFSMKAAGLNPILASGATPGHSAAMQGSVGGKPGGAGVGSAVAANRQAGVGERNVRINEVKAPYEVGESMMRRYQIAQNINLTEASTAETQARTKLALEQSTTQAIERLLKQKQAEREGWSSKQIQRELEGRIGGNVYQDPIGYINNVLTGQPSKQDGSLRGLGGVILRRVDENHSAKGNR